MRQLFTKRQADLTSQRGLTALEIVITVMISSLLIAALLRFMSFGHPLAKTAYLQAQSTDTARLQLKRIAKLLREARYADTGAYPLLEVSPQRIIFFANADTDATTERIRYELNGTNLERGMVKPSGDPLTYDLAQEQVTVVTSAVRNGSDPIFTYYTGDYPADPTPLTPTDLTEVKYIQFRLLIDADPAIDPPAIEVVSQVQLRNLKTNLGETVE
ncbi:MAG: type II secretion system protein [Candidatus Andersenbacteria bacterium]